MVRRQAHGKHGFDSLKRACWFGLLILCAGGCATREKIVVHSEPRVVSEGESRLLLESEPLEDGSILLRVIRETVRGFEMEYWNQQAVRGRREQTLTVASSNIDWFQLLDPRLVLTMILGTYYLVVGMAEMVEYLIAQARKSLLSMFPDSEIVQGPEVSTRSTDQFTLRWTVTERRPSSSVTLYLASNPGAILLGPQPEDGYRLDPALIEHFGGRCARIVVSDGELSTTGTLGSPR